MRLTTLIAAACALAGALFFATRDGGAPTDEQPRTRDGDVPADEQPDVSAAAIATTPLGLTLSPARVAAGEMARFLVAGPLLAEPAEGADTLRVAASHDSVTLVRELPRGERRWVETQNGWVAAPLIDRFPEAILGTLPAGAEGMVAGRALPWSYAPEDLVTVPRRFIDPISGGREIELRGPALEAFTAMARDAANEGIEITVVSGFRSAEYQAGLYARQLRRRGFFQDVSAPPGRSEHQLGTTLDISSPGSAALEVEFGETAAGRWVSQNAARFGFVVSFSLERHAARQVSYEPWHIRWVDENLNRSELW